MRFLSAALAAFCLLASTGCRGRAPQQQAAAPAPRAEILWDRYGVPHIFAADAPSLFHAFGWAQMEAHGDLILQLYGRARGRAAEYWGASELDSDKRVLRAGVPARAREWLEQQTPDARQNLKAFVRGMNDYALQHAASLDASRRVVLPVTASDVLAHTQLVLYVAFVSGGEEERARGSNAWAIAPARSASGSALLLANPHLPWSDFFTWFEAHLQAPGVNASGAALVGQDLLGIAFNEHLGWTHTVNTIDPADTYELQVVGNGYRYDGAVRPFEVVTHQIRVKLQDGTYREEPFVVKRSVQGVVFDEKPGRALALRIAGLDQPNLPEQYWRMLRATNLTEFEAALRMLQMPMFTVIYADRDGHILHLFGGRTPLRPPGPWDWSGTVPGETSATLWTKTLTYDELPRVVDPPTGWLQNANDPPWTTSFPAVLDPNRFPPYVAPRHMGFRPQRSAGMLATTDKMTWDDLLRKGQDTHMELADRILDDLEAAVAAHGDADAKRAMALLNAWDRTADGASRGAVLFVDWYGKAAKHGELPFAVQWSEAKPRSTPDGLADPRAAAAALSAAAKDVEKTYGRLDVAWGDAYRLRRDGIDLPSNGADGTYGVFHVTDYSDAKNGRHEADGGNSYIAAVEFKTPLRARSLVGYGNWSQPGSKHRTDQLELYSRKELKPVWLTRPEVEANLERRETFQ